ncbi:MAG TPA: SDR family oxidoreductase [Flavitalea sp.]|nr:SDR family oxidoreductase [Flavitalea sp.]
MPTVLILGAASDMAMAIAEKFASKGYALQLAARNAQRLEPVKSDLEIRYGIAVQLVEFDALSFEAHQLFFDQVSPKPDVTICVFGYLGDQEKAMKHWSEAAAILHTNYTGAVSILNVAADYYASRRSGTIVGISSVAGERGRQSNYIYGSAKAGFTAYLSGLRNRMCPLGVHVATIQPGFAYTRMTEHLSLPPLLTATPKQVGEAVYKAVMRKRNTTYVKGIWRWIMCIIRCIPEFIFKKMKL